MASKEEDGTSSICDETTDGSTNLAGILHLGVLDEENEKVVGNQVLDLVKAQLSE
jgi:hypothetical protein